MNRFHTPELDKLFKGILSLKTVEECYNFFTDVCTIRELKEIAQRFDVACNLSEGKSYSQISKDSGASTATISRVNKCLLYGNDGYKIAIKRLKQAKGE